MFGSIKHFWVKNTKYFSYFISFAGLVFYIFQSWNMANTMSSTIFDESGYIARGFLVVSGRYEMYADGGPFFDHMPLSFIIPGIFQVLFGPGIRTARHLSFAIGLFSLIGLWIATRKVGGSWWAAIVLWIFALNPRWIENFSLGYSQGIVTLFTSWGLVFLIGEHRKNWQIALAASLAGLAGMTRLNMVPVLFFFILYFFWQQGKKAGLIALISGMLTVAFINLFFWPGILKIWVLYIPEGLFPFLASYRVPFEVNYLPSEIPLTGWINDPDHIMWEVFTALRNSIKTNFIPIFGVLSSAIFWPKKKAWDSTHTYKLAILLLSLYVFLFFFHAWASLGGVSCNFDCFDPYLQFFSNIGLLVCVISSKHWFSKHKWWQTMIVILLTPLSIRLFIKKNLIKTLLTISFPREGYKKGIFIWQIITNKTNVNFNPVDISADFFNQISWGLAFAIFFVLLFIAIIVLVNQKRNFSLCGGVILSILLIVSSVIFISKPILGPYLSVQCPSSIFDSYEIAGEEITNIIPKDSLVFTHIDSWMSFLEYSEIRIFPALTMYRYTYLTPEFETDREMMEKFGYWNDEVKLEWLDQSDFVIVEGRFIKDWNKEINSGEYTIVTISSPVEPCRGNNAQIFILTKND